MRIPNRSEQAQRELDIAERYADEGMSETERAEAAHVYYSSGVNLSLPFDLQAATAAKAAGLGGVNAFAYAAIFGEAADDQLLRTEQQLQSAQRTEDVRWADLVRDIFGNPFRSVSVLPAWLTTTVVSLASAAYAERELPSGHLHRDRLAVLSDALEEAGCDNAEILTHLRSDGPHVRGCWAVDLVRSVD